MGRRLKSERFQAKESASNSPLQHSLLRSRKGEAAYLDKRLAREMTPGEGANQQYRAFSAGNAAALHLASI
jgi:hypothetical protein